MRIRQHFLLTTNDLPHPRLVWPHNKLVVVRLWGDGQVPVVGHRCRRIGLEATASHPRRHWRHVRGLILVLRSPIRISPVMLWAGGLVIEIVVSSDRHETLLGRRKCPPHLVALELVRPHTWICPQILTETVVSTRRSCWVLKHTNGQQERQIWGGGK